MLVDRRKAAEYLTNVRRVEMALLDAISESLGLERDYIEKRLGGHYVSLNYYRACEQSELELTYGVRGHTDPTIITMLLQDDVPGLQVLSEGKWMDVNPIPDTVVVHVGDLLQVIYKNIYDSLITINIQSPPIYGNYNILPCHAMTYFPCCYNYIFLLCFYCIRQLATIDTRVCSIKL